jgi:hypothetical protein
LADARHIADRPPQDWSRAVLLAAIACELKVKETLRQLATDSNLPLVDLLLDSPRDFSMQVAGLFDKAMTAVHNESLRESDRELYKAIDRLFQVRNQIAHYGVRPTPEQGSHAVGAAASVVAWLGAQVAAGTAGIDSRARPT